MEKGNVISHRKPISIKITAIFFMAWGLSDILLTELIPNILNFTLNIVVILFTLLGVVVTSLKFFIGIGIWKMKQWAWKLGLFILIYAVFGIVYFLAKNIICLYDISCLDEIEESLILIIVNFLIFIIFLSFLIFFLRRKLLVYFDLESISRIKIVGKLSGIAVGLLIFILILPRLIMYINTV